MIPIVLAGAAAAAPLAFPSAGSCADRASLVLVGDVMAHLSQVEAARTATGHDFSGQFAAVEPWIAAADLAIANLETVTAGEDLGGYTGFRRFNTPEALLPALAASGFDVIQTGNNHCMDRDEPGLIRTLDALDRHGLAHAGTYRSAAERADGGFALRTLSGGMKVAFLAYTYSSNGYWPPEDKPWLVNYTWPKTRLVGDVAAAREAADLVVVGVHTGREYTPEPEDWFVALADTLVDAGADVIMGTHPHVLQPAKVRTHGGRDALVLYSLGNFVSAQREPPRDGGVIATLDVAWCAGRATLAGVRFLPVWVDADRADDSVAYRVLPTPPEGGGCTGDADVSDGDCARMGRHRAHAAAMLGAANLSWERPR